MPGTIPVRTATDSAWTAPRSRSGSVESGVSAPTGAVDEPAALAPPVAEPPSGAGTGTPS